MRLPDLAIMKGQQKKKYNAFAKGNMIRLPDVDGIKGKEKVRRNPSSRANMRLPDLADMKKAKASRQPVGVGQKRDCLRWVITELASMTDISKRLTTRLPDLEGKRRKREKGIVKQVVLPLTGQILEIIR